MGRYHGDPPGQAPLRPRRPVQRVCVQADHPGGMETGYLQVDALGGELCTGAYSFTGIPAYEGLAEEGGGTASEERLYFFGGISYGVRLEDRELPADGLSGKGERRDGGGAVPAHGGAGAAPTGGVRDDERRILRQEGAPLY